MAIAESLATESPIAQEKYPWFWKLFGVLCILGGADALGDMCWSIYEIVMREGLAAARHEYTDVTIVITVIAIVLAVALAAMFFVLGIRMLLDRRRKAAFLANIMIVITVVIGLCEFMIWGMSPRLIPTFAATVILVVVQSYSDPTLREERQLQFKLRQMENRSAAEDGTLGRDETGKGYIKLNFFNLFWIFVIACIAGLVVEVIYHMAVVEPGVYQDRAGLLYGPFSPIYGVGAVLMTVALNRFHDANPLIIFLVAAVIGGAFEFFVSWFMETAFGIVAWDYTGTFLSIGGRTNGMFMCMWGALGLVWIKFALPVMLKIVNKIPWNWRYAVTSVCAVLMFVDAGLTLASLDCWYQREDGTMNYDNPSAIVAFCNDHYDNDFMTKRFQSMTMDTDRASRA